MKRSIRPEKSTWRNFKPSIQNRWGCCVRLLVGAVYMWNWWLIWLLQWYLWTIVMVMKKMMMLTIVIMTVIIILRICLYYCYHDYHRHYHHHYQYHLYRHHRCHHHSIIINSNKQSYRKRSDKKQKMESTLHCFQWWKTKQSKWDLLINPPICLWANHFILLLLLLLLFWLL